MKNIEYYLPRFVYDKYSMYIKNPFGVKPITVEHEERMSIQLEKIVDGAIGMAMSDENLEFFNRKLVELFLKWHQERLLMFSTFYVFQSENES